MLSNNAKLRLARLDAEIRSLGDFAYAPLGAHSTEDKYRDVHKAMNERSRKLDERSALLREEEAPLLEDLKINGFDVDTIGRLAASGKSYDGLLPLLIDHMQRDYHFDTKAAIAFVVGHSSARPYWDVIRQEFEKSRPDNTVYDAALAHVFVNTATVDDIDEIIDLIDNTTNPERYILLKVLRDNRSKSPTAEEAVQRLARNARFAREIASWPDPEKPS